MHRRQKSQVTSSPQERLQKQCKTRHVLLTRKRLTILRIIVEATSHQDAKEIHLQANLQDCRISIGTVYRAIRFFEKLAVIRRIDLGRGRARFAATTQTGNHHRSTPSATTSRDDPDIVRPARPETFRPSFSSPSSTATES